MSLGCRRYAQAVLSEGVFERREALHYLSRSMCIRICSFALAVSLKALMPKRFRSTSATDLITVMSVHAYQDKSIRVRLEFDLSRVGVGRVGRESDLSTHR